jgi:hypothetical protein
MKPIVHYRKNQHDRIAVGTSAFLFGGTVDHPKTSNRVDGPVLTSPVISISNTNLGCFETENTKYVPEE